MRSLTRPPTIRILLVPDNRLDRLRVDRLRGVAWRRVFLGMEVEELGVVVDTRLALSRVAKSTRGLRLPAPGKYRGMCLHLDGQD